MKNKYVAEYLGDTVTVETDFTDLHKLIRELNDLGFKLGSGHDGISIDFHLRDHNEDSPVDLILSPYPGKMTQYIQFKQIK